MSQAGDNQTVTEDAPEWVWNAQYRKIFGSNNLLEAKFTGYWGYYYLDPVDPSIFTFDGESGEYSGGGGGLYYADRTRNQLQVSFTKYANKFGRHSLKFGAEIERSHVRSQYQPYGPAGVYIYAYGGVPYYGVSYGYDVQGDNRRTSAYAQDQWQAGRVTLNIGLRLDHLSGFSPVLDETVYKPNTSWGPRVGMAFDLTGKGTSAIKAFWGRYFEGAASAFYTQATPGVQDYSHLEILPNGGFGPPDVVIPGIVYGIGDDINHPRTDEFNLSFETQLTRTLRLTATGIWRRSNDFINNVIDESRWAPVTLPNGLTNQTFTGYRWANSDTTDENFFIRNTEGFQYVATDGSVIATADPRRNYKGLMLLLSSSLRNSFGYQVSYVLSKAEGNVDNSGFGPYLQGYDLELAEHRDHQQLRRADELEAARTESVRVLSGASGGRAAGHDLLRAERQAVHAVPAIQCWSVESAGFGTPADPARAARQPNERLLQPGRSPGGEGVQVRGEPIRCLYRHPEPVQHQHRTDPPGPGSEHNDLG